MFFSFLLAAPLAFAEDFQSKDDWRNKMLSEERVEKTLCHDKSYLVVCTTEFTSPKTSEKTKLNTDTCREAAKEMVEASLSNGNPAGLFYEKLPANLSKNAMTEYGNMLGDMIGRGLIEAVKKNGGGEVMKPMCIFKRQTAFQVDGK